jgi:diketogulonate reductase-like aldo/keto reductase
LIALQEEGLVKHIGVSNFCIAHLEEIKVGVVISLIMSDAFSVSA